ncbi:MAG: dipeptidase PepE [Flavobacteriales bacterium]|nr:Peptidase E [Flavobacteriales bacterium]MCC6577681.1 dipeptidase PepE [Flavobacteriales bacterium]NUQ16073.1 dipeptidase PepE [Flavobacteriales bacterium]
MQLLLLSNSTLPGEPFLGWPRAHLEAFLGPGKRIAFVPFAAVTMGLDEYAGRVREVLGAMGHELIGLHAQADPVKALADAEAVMIGGGNTFQLLRMLYKHDLVRAIRARVVAGVPFVGWSAGSNVACPSIMTTNDMPITEPPSLRALDLVPFQINPHYTEARLEGHGGETRDQRIEEFLALNPRSVVAGLREGTLLRVEGERLVVEGRGMRVFRRGREPREFAGGAELRSSLADA